MKSKAEGDLFEATDANEDTAYIQRVVAGVPVGNRYLIDKANLAGLYEPADAPPRPFVIGDVAKLKCGGMPMVMNEEGLWEWHDERGTPHCRKYDAACLERVTVAASR